MLLTDTPHEVGIVAVDAEGRPSGDGAVELKLYKIDSSRAFTYDKDLRKERSLVQFSRKFLAALRGLDHEDAHKRLKKWLNNPQFEALMAQIPNSMKHLPVYLTEAGSGPTGVEYPNENTLFIDQMFKYVHEWNQRPDTQKIRSVNFYRWQWKIGGDDHWGIEHKPGMIADFLTALDNEYYWRAP